MEELGNIISQRRKELGLTLEAVADAVGVGKSTVRKWEKGMIKNMGRDKIAALAKVLQMDPVRFVTFDLEAQQTAKNEADLETVLAKLHANPRLGLLFDRTRQMEPEDVEFMLQMADRILKERDD